MTAESRSSALSPPAPPAPPTPPTPPTPGGAHATSPSDEGTAHASSARAVKVDARLRGHMTALDGVRGLAIGMVLVLHFIGNAQTTNKLERVAFAVAGYGEFGVDLFFILSGFLITGILFDSRESKNYFRSFYMRRALRIFPLYYGILAIIFFVLPWIPYFAGPELHTLQANQGWAWLYGVNILIAMRGEFMLPYIDHFWSLAVEEHFYFVWPLIVWLSPARVLVRVSAAIILGAFALRLGCTMAHVSPVAIYVLTPFRLDSLVLGGLLAVLARRPGGMESLQRAIKPVAIVASLVLVGTFVFNRFSTLGLDVLRPIRNSMIIALLATVLFGALTSRADTLFGRFFRSASMRFLGKYSYGLYIFHHFIAYFCVHHETELVLARWVGSHTLAVLIQAVLATLLSLGIAIVSFDVFEKRALALKRFWPSQGDKSAA